LDHDAAGDLLAGAAANRLAPARNAPQKLRAAIPQQPADRVTHAADPSGAGCPGDQKPVTGERGARAKIKTGRRGRPLRTTRQPAQAVGLYADWRRSEPELVHEIAPKIVE